MPYSENGVPITITNDFSPGGYVTKTYLIDAYPQLSDQAKMAGVWGWGQNNVGQLADNTSVNKSSPVQTISGGANWRNISTYAGIKSDGRLWLWGSNAYGNLGDNSRTNRLSPVQTVSGGTDWLALSNNVYNTACIKTDGRLWTWGNNQFGNLGDNTLAPKSSPVQTVSGGTNWKQVSMGFLYAAAIKTDNSLWLWGYGFQGALGNNAATDRSSPIQTVSGGTNWRSVYGGYNMTGAIKTDGTLWLWGRNDYGQLGNNTDRNPRSSPIQTVSGGTNWKQVTGGTYYTIAIKTDGTLWGWGSNQYGQLGDNTRTRRSSPVQTVAGGTNWRLTASTSSDSSAAAIKADGTLWLWGRNQYGQLGDNTTADKSSPVQTVSGGTNWKQISSVFAMRDFNEDF